MSKDWDEIEAIFRSVDREIWIVTAASGERRGGLVATWVSHSSIDRERPVVSAGIAPNHFTGELINESGRFALHLITAAQAAMALRFALGSGRDQDKFADVDFTLGESGSPILTGALSWLECQVFSQYETGDRIYYWADITAAQRRGDAAPLRTGELMALASDQQRAELQHDLRHDVAALRPLAERWRKDLSAS